MHEQSILIVTPNRKTQRIVQRILGVTGYPIDIADALEQGIRLMQHRRPLVVVVDDHATSAPGADEFFAAARAHGAEACMTLFSGDETDPKETMPRILELGAISNLLVHAMPILAEELTTTVHKLIRGDLFGAEKYLLWGTELYEHTVTRSSERAGLISKLAQDVRERGQSARVASMAMLVADELISNAVHNAPVDASGEHFRRDVARDTEIALSGRETVRLRWGCDARYLAIEVGDQYGSLDKDTILKSLARSNVRESGGGAGMGVASCYRSCDHLVFNLSPGIRTEIIALIDVRHPHTERTAVSSYNVFVERERP